MSGIGHEEISSVYNLVISTASANILANSFKKSWLIELGPVIASVASLFIALVSIIISQKSHNVSRNLFVASIQKMYFEVISTLPLGEDKDISDDHFLLMLNYYEFICDLYYKKILKNEDINFISERMKAKTPITKLIVFSKIINNQNVFKNYTKWLNENKIEIK